MNEVTVVVKRSEWIRGEGEIKSYLLRSADNKKCCLGFAALACGLSPDDIAARKAPHWVDSARLSCMSGENVFLALTDDYILPSPVASQLMEVNDDRTRNDTDRERKITELGAGIGLFFEFVD